MVGVASGKPMVSVVACEAHDPDAIRQSVLAALAPLGGIRRFVRPGMKVLLKPNLVSDADLERAVTTHPSVIRAVAELVQEAGGAVQIGDSPGGPARYNQRVWSRSGVAAVADQTGACLVPFDTPVWKCLNGSDYFIALAAMEADLVINLPKLKTHLFALYTGGVKNLCGVVPGTRKRDLHLRAPGIADFSRILVDLFDLIQPGLTILDGVMGLEGNGPGVGGIPRPYRCIAASADAVALDAVIAQALGYRTNEVLHLGQASARGLGVSDPHKVHVVGDRRALDFGRVDLPKTRWYFCMPSWVGTPLCRMVQVRPRVLASSCVGCGRCVEVCPSGAIEAGRPPFFDLAACIGCLCCAEICPQGAIEPQRNLLARLVGVGQ